jgi:membrane fusion protein (multidrug efflux system)
MNPKKLIAVISILTVSLMFFYTCGNGSAKEEGKISSDSAAGDSVGTDSSGSAGKMINEKDEEKKNKQTSELIPVEVTTVKIGVITDYILLSANLETEKMADVYSRVQGLVENIYIEEGDYIKKGQVMIVLEADEYKLAEEKARLNYLKQKSDFERLEAMYKQDLLSIEEFQQARFTMQSLEVDWKQAKLNLSYTRITSPISGVVGDRLRKPGDRIQPTNKLFTVINTGEMIAVVYAPEKELGNVKKSQSAFVTSDHITGEKFEGWIKRVSPVIDPQSGTFKITIGVKNRENRLRSGMFVNTHIITATHNNAVLIPKRAIVYENEVMNVFIVRDSLAHKLILKVGFQDHEKVESLEGISEGDLIIVIGQAGLKDKTKVKIVNVKQNDLAYLTGRDERI